ncbi:MAG: universal stress protein [Betaproteobacteria bacterium]
MFKQVLVAVDGSPTSNRGLKAAIGLAADQHASLAIVHVVDTMASMAYVGDMSYVPASYVDDMLDDLRSSGRRILGKAEGTARGAGVEAKTFLVETKGGTVAEAILAQARKARADVIVLGTHGRRGLSRVLMGSDAETVLREARVPVMLVRAPEAAARSGGTKAAARNPAKPGARKTSAGTAAASSASSRARETTSQS